MKKYIVLAVFILGTSLFAKSVKVFNSKIFIKDDAAYELKEKYPMCDVFIKSFNKHNALPKNKTVCLELKDKKYAKILQFKTTKDQYIETIYAIVQPYIDEADIPKEVNSKALGLKSGNSFFAYDVNHDDIIDFLEIKRPNIFYSQKKKHKYALVEYMDYGKSNNYTELLVSKDNYCRFYMLDKNGKYIGAKEDYKGSYYLTDGKDLYFKGYDDVCNLSRLTHNSTTNQKGK